MACSCCCMAFNLGTDLTKTRHGTGADAGDRTDQNMVPTQAQSKGAVQTGAGDVGAGLAEAGHHVHGLTRGLAAITTACLAALAPI